MVTFPAFFEGAARERDSYRGNVPAREAHNCWYMLNASGPAPATWAEYVVALGAEFVLADADVRALEKLIRLR